jgi:uncharacterized protein with GYD domain
MSDGRAIVLLRTAPRRQETARALARMEGVTRVKRVQGPYDFVIHAAGPAQVEMIERLPGVTAAEVCWLSPRSQGGSG